MKAVAAVKAAAPVEDRSVPGVAAAEETPQMASIRALADQLTSGSAPLDCSSSQALLTDSAESSLWLVQ